MDVIEEDDPTSFHGAMESKESAKWIEAMRDEMRSMDANGVWVLADLPTNRKAIECKWIFKTKRDAQGKVDRYKARLVA